MAPTLAALLALQIAVTLQFAVTPAALADSTEPTKSSGPSSKAAAEQCPDVEPAPKEGPDTSSVVSRVVFKHGPTFIVATPEGMLNQTASTACGLYCDDTRYLSTLEWSVDGKRPALLSSFTDGGYKGQFVYGVKANKDASDNTISITREIVISDSISVGLNDRLNITNYGIADKKMSISLLVDSDFCDMFEVRGMKRERHGKHNGIQRENARTVHLSYVAVDGRALNTWIGFNRDPSEATGKQSKFDLTVKPGQTETIDVSIVSCDGKAMPAFSAYDEILNKADQSYVDWRSQTATIETDNPVFNKMIEQCFRDIYVLRQTSAGRRCIAAGIPWYAVPFGRDQCVTALQTLPLAPDIARDALTFLAAYQGKDSNEKTEERPGKIMHELRLGEMAACQEIPFTPYYGTVDATPLWLVLLGRYVETTNDLKLAKELWPNALAALSYIKTEMSENRHSSNGGFLTYGRGCTGALSNQGWKDSGDSIVHADGTLAKRPIALCEVQGYVYEALVAMAQLQRRLGFESAPQFTSQQGSSSEELEKAAEELKQRFNKSFWLTDKQFIALAVDGDNKPCSVISSNPGHLLFTNIVSDEQAASIANRLMKDDMYSGWGIRTLASTEKAYNPMGYHTGSVWPHDNGIIAAGMAKRGFPDYPARILTGLFESAQATGTARLPELFCGFPRKEYAAPIAYPVSCSPQSWAAGSILQTLLACTGNDKGQATASPLSFVRTLKIKNIWTAGKKIDMQ